MKLMPSTFLVLVCIVALQSFPVYAQESPDPKVVEAARKEGEIVWYTTMSLDQSKQFMDRFLRKYPFLKPSFFDPEVARCSTGSFRRPRRGASKRP